MSGGPPSAELESILERFSENVKPDIFDDRHMERFSTPEEVPGPRVLSRIDTRLESKKILESEISEQEFQNLDREKSPESEVTTGKDEEKLAAKVLEENDEQYYYCEEEMEDEDDLEKEQDEDY